MLSRLVPGYCVSAPYESIQRGTTFFRTDLYGSMPKFGHSGRSIHADEGHTLVKAHTVGAGEREPFRRLPKPSSLPTRLAQESCLNKSPAIVSWENALARSRRLDFQNTPHVFS